MTQVAVDDKDFEAAFGEAAVEAEQKVQAAPVKDDESVPVKTPEELKAEEAAKVAAEAKAVEDAKAKEAQDKVAAEEAAKAEANKGKTPEQIAAEEAKVKEEADAKAVREKVEADAAKVRQEAEIRVQAEQKVKDDAAAKVKADEDRKKKEEALKPYEPSEDEKKALEAFKKEFPNEYVAMEARFKVSDREFQRQVHAAVQAVMEQVGKVVTPLAQGFEAESLEKHTQGIYTAHKDYDDVIGLVPDWIKKQPAYIQVAYQHAYDAGSTQEVIDLITRFKQETGRVAAPEKKEDLKSKPGPTAEEIASGLPVNTKRAAVSGKGTPDPNDYDGAFAEAAGVK